VNLSSQKNFSFQTEFTLLLSIQQIISPAGKLSIHYNKQVFYFKWPSFYHMF